jgi:hypothetical protein
MAAVNYTSLSTFWDWNWGSAVFLWHWGREYQLEVVMGLDPCWVGPKPTSLEPQCGLGSEEDMWKLWKKIQLFLDPGYFSEGAVKALINYFVITKGEDIGQCSMAQRLG